MSDVLSFETESLILLLLPENSAAMLYSGKNVFPTYSSAHCACQLLKTVPKIIGCFFFNSKKKSLVKTVR